MFGMEIVLEMTITFGNLLQIASMLAAGVTMYVRLSNRLTALETKVDALWDRFQHRRSDD